MSHSASRLRATTVSVFALTVILAGCARSNAGSRRVSSSPSGTAAATAGSPVPVRPIMTAIHVFAAYGSDGALTAGVAAHRSGSCFTTSIIAASARAYRCFAGSQILDPCFAASSTAVRTVACYADPWSRATRLTLTAELPAATTPLKITRPWALELADGQRCVVATGTTPTAHGVSFGYHCDSGTAGLRSTSGRAWRALYRPSAGALREVKVAAVWKA